MVCNSEKKAKEEEEEERVTPSRCCLSVAVRVREALIPSPGLLRTDGKTHTLTSYGNKVTLMFMERGEIICMMKKLRVAMTQLARAARRVNVAED